MLPHLISTLLGHPAPSGSFLGGTLPGNYRMGAEYWASQRSLAHPGSCEQDSPDFTAGCKGTKPRLTPTDYLRKTDPEYKAGWNAYGH
jgi:hypothetical protein